MNKERMHWYLSLLESELIPAAGCTEPIALAYCAAKVREILEGIPERLAIGVSSNILKNVKSVTVPSTGGLKGVRAAVAAGVLGGDSSMDLQVIRNVPAEMEEEIRKYTGNTPMKVFILETLHVLDIEITGFRGQNTATVRISDNHNNIVHMEKNGGLLVSQPTDAPEGTASINRPRFSLREILEFAAEVPGDLLGRLFEPQITSNSAIAEEGLRNDWGAGIGRILLQSGRADIETEAKAYAASGSDARMGGCDLPVVILSGSGNQGLTASLPVIRYARHVGATPEDLYRALAVSALVTIYQKSGIGKLSAYCGAVSAGVGAGAGIAFLLDGSYEAVAHTITNALAVISGTLCDGAKPSCAAKIAASVDSGILGYKMYKEGKQFCSGEGIIIGDVDSTIEKVGIIAKDGMSQTDRTIIEMMVEC